jgi:hypothetical protein
LLVSIFHLIDGGTAKPAMKVQHIRRIENLLLHTMPTVITHNFHPDRGAFRNVCTQPQAEAERIIAAIRLGGHAYLKENYLDRRMRTESWLIAERQRKIGETPLARPIYFFLGRMDDGWDRSRPASVVLSLALFNPQRVTFTFPDSMTSCPHLRSSDQPDTSWHGQVFTLGEVTRMITRHGFPDPNQSRKQRGPDAFIEVQVWDDGPLENIRRQADLS